MIKAIISAEVIGLPPKSHSLLSLAQKASIQLPHELQEFIELLDNVSIVTRYPEDFKKMSREFNKKKAEEVFAMTRRTLKWLSQVNLYVFRTGHSQE